MMNLSRRMSMSRRQSGVTMLELMITLTVVAILLTIAVPSITEIIKNNRVTGQNNELVALINLARNEAIRRNLDLDGTQDVVLRLDATTDGWSGNVVVTGGTTAPGCPVGVIRCADNSRVDFTPATIDIRFDSRGYLANFTETTLCLSHADCNGERQHRRLTIFPSGRIESGPLSCNDACP